MAHLRASHRAVAISLLVSVVVVCGCTPQKPEGDSARGATIYVEGDGTAFGCANCHCSDATGDCRLSAPDIRGAGYTEIDARTRNSSTYHPGAKFDFTDQDIADLEAYLATLVDGN